jgi:hypothetical protein
MWLNVNGPDRYGARPLNGYPPTGPTEPRRLGFQPFRGLWVRSLCAIQPHSAGAGG